MTRVQWAVFMTALLMFQEARLHGGFQVHRNHKQWIRHVCHQTISEDDVSKLRIMASMYLSLYPNFRKNVLRSLPDHYFKPPPLIPLPYIYSVEYCANGPNEFPMLATHTELEETFSMLNFVMPTRCMGVYISQTWVMMPAHCVSKNNYSSLKFLFYSKEFLIHNRNLPIIHELFNERRKHDIAVVELKAPNKKILPACAPDVWTDLPPVGVSCVVTIWEETNGKQIMMLAKVKIDWYDYSRIFVISQSPDMYLDFAEGVLMCRVDGELTIVGLSVPYVDDGTDIYRYAFTRVSSYTHWIVEKIAHGQPLVSMVELMQPVDPKMTDFY